jgi:hypothetical protein
MTGDQNWLVGDRGQRLASVLYVGGLVGILLNAPAAFSQLADFLLKHLWEPAAGMLLSAFGGFASSSQPSVAQLPSTIRGVSFHALDSPQAVSF